MPLTVAPVGKEMKVVKSLVNANTKRHLEDLGLLVGTAVTIIADNAGDLIVKLKDSRIAINKSLAMRIFVE